MTTPAAPRSLPGPFDPFDPFDPKDPTGPKDGPSGPAAVAALDTDVPLTMLPVRLATRLHRQDPDAAPTELWVRIFPDVIHVDGHIPELTKAEIALGRSYWERIWRAAGDQLRRSDAHRWLVDQTGAPRAAWIVSATTPVNPGDAPKQPVTDGAPLRRHPQLPPLAARTSTRAALARLLPDRWHVTVRHSIEFVERKWSSRVRRDLAIAPQLVDIADGDGARELLRKQGLWWMVDFDEAVDAGMAVRVPWNPPQGGPRFATEVIVFGVRADHTGADDELTSLLDAHRFTSALEIVPPGTPTNNTDTVRAGFVAIPDDLEAFFARQTSAVSTRDRPPPDRPLGLSTTGAADAAARALGIGDATALHRAEHATRATGSWAQAMNRVLWPATFEHLLADALATAGVPALADDDRTWLADWCRDWVRAGGLLPTLRVGAQPYGLLPVNRKPSRADLGESRLDRLRDVLLDLDDFWRVSLPGIPNYSAKVGGPFGIPLPTPEQEAVRLAAVLGAVPHPTAFRLRPASVRRADIEEEWDAAIAGMEELLEQSHDDLHNQVYRLFRKEQILEGDVATQALGLTGVRDFAHSMLDPDTSYSEEHRDAAAAARDQIDRDVRPLVAAHELRSETRVWTMQSTGAHLPTAEDPELWYVEHGDDGSAPDGTFPMLQLVPDEPPAVVAATLRGFARDARRASGTVRPAYLASRSRSLIEKLAEFAVMHVATDRTEDLALGFEGLAAVLEDDGLDDPLVELTRLLRETIGLATHRLDAWVSSVANQRLAGQRVKRPQGLQVGGYGWVVNLEPDEAARADSKGFVHAPSLDHAATAAVLRSAWLNVASDAADAPFGVDVSSSRVRRAQWLLEGVRNGVELGELLGARFERRLHDAGRADLIADVRRIVLDATGHVGEATRSIVDGLAIAVAYRDPTDDAVHDAIEAWRATLPGFPSDGVGGPLRATVADLDATADLLTTQAVHSVIKGSMAEATASLSVAGAGDAGLPQVRVPAVHRDAQVLTHRLLAVLPAVVPATSGPLLAVAEPALAGWVAGLLPQPAQVDITFDAGSRGRWTGTLGDLGLSALEVVALATADGVLESSPLGQVVGAAARRRLGLEVDDGGVLSGALAQVAVVAGALASTLGGARPLRGDDLTPTAGLAHGVGLDDLIGRRDALATRLAELGASNPDPALLSTRLADLAALDPGGVVAALGDPHGEHVAALLQTAASRAAALGAPLPDDWDARSPDARAALLIERIRAAFGVSIPVLPVTTPANAAEVAASLASSPRRVPSPATVLSWLIAAGRVHDGAGRCAEALDLAEALDPRVVVPIQVAQVPHVEDEPWVAIAAPTAPGSRLDLVCVTDAATALAGDAVSGLVFDAWSEPLPGEQATTGVAVHLDQPGARPPQAVLLALAPEQGPWTVEHIEATLLDTLDLAMKRAVGPETLTRLGHTLPAVALAAGVAVDVAVDTIELEGAHQ